MALRIVFCGTPTFAVPSLGHLIQDRAFKVEAVITQPDRPRGRGREITASPVKEAAVEAGIQVYQPEKIKSYEAYEFLTELRADAVVMIAYGQIISQKLIDLPRLGWVNLHASLLPKYRGAAPINWAIINGEHVTGLTTMQIDSGLDTGPILMQQEMKIGMNETAPELTKRLADVGAPLVARTLRALDAGEIKPKPQNDSHASYARSLEKEDGRIDWSMDARTIHRRIRGLQPWPGAFTTFRGKTCHIWGEPAPGSSHALAPGTIFVESGRCCTACGERTALHLEFFQLEGRKRITAQEFLNGARLATGEFFSS